jgi:hypothetical protein
MSDELQEQAMTDDRERKAAEAKFKKSERATEGAKAMSEYNAERQAERAKTVRLKALREAREAAESGPRRTVAPSKSPRLILNPSSASCWCIQQARGQVARRSITHKNKTPQIAGSCRSAHRTAGDRGGSGPIQARLLVC